MSKHLDKVIQDICFSLENDPDRWFYNECTLTDNRMKIKYDLCFVECFDEIRCALTLGGDVVNFNKKNAQALCKAFYKLKTIKPSVEERMFLKLYGGLE